MNEIKPPEKWNKISEMVISWDGLIADQTL